jgi:uncharacterized repeat protein (TIGR01451 family)
MGENEMVPPNGGGQRGWWVVLGWLLLPALASLADAEPLAGSLEVMRSAPAASSHVSRPPVAAPTAAPALNALQAGFIENIGQVDERVAFYRRTGRQTLWLTADGVVFDLRRRDPAAGPRSRMDGLRVRSPDDAERLIFRQEFIGASPAAAMEPRQLVPGLHNYFLGNDPSRWRTGVRAFNGVLYRGMWDGIDFLVQGNGRHLEQEFIVRPGADPGQIRVAYRGIEGLRLGEDGSLVIATAFGELREHAPTIYQVIDGKRIAVSGRFQLLGPAAYTFELGPYQRRYALVIDPTVVYSTYIGGSGDDGIFQEFAVDATGAAYVAGSTDSVDFPAQPGAPQAAAGGLRDAFVAKLDAAGTALIFATYLGGSGQDDPHAGVALDSSGNVYVTGTTTSTNFPVQAALQPAIAGVRDAFVAKLNATGSALLFSTYLGGTGSEFAQGMAIDPSTGGIVLVGDTDSINFPVTAGAVQTVYGGGPADGFVARLTPTGSAVAYATYLGGAGEDSAKRISLDGTGIYIAGSTTSATGFPVVSALQSALAGGIDGFVTKLNLAGTTVLYSTYLGGSGDDAIFALGVDDSGNAFVAGSTSSTNFPIGNALQPVYGGGDGDGFLTKLGAGPPILLFSTYLGGSGHDEVTDLVLDAAGNPYVTGLTASTNFPTRNAVQATYGGGPFDGFVTMVSSTGLSLLSSTFIGGTGDDEAFALAIDAAGDVYVAGWTTTANLPVTGGPAFAGVADAFVTKLTAVSANVGVTASASPSPVLSGVNLTYTITVTNLGPDTAVDVTLSNAVPTGTTFQSLSPSTGCTTPPVNGSGMVTCQSSTLASGASVVRTLVVRVTAASGSLTSTAAVTAASPDPTPGNNGAITTTAVTAAGSISGTVTQGAGGPSPGAAIAGALINVRNADTGAQLASGTTDAAGNFTIPGLAPRTYKVSAEANGFATRFFNNQVSFTPGNAVTVSGGATTGGVNFALPGNAGGISGRVTLADGVTPVVNASIGIRTADGAQLLFVSTDVNGNYNSQRRMAQGTYLVRVVATGFPSTYYVSARSAETATPVAVTANADTTGINVKLAAAVGGISGRVTQAGTGAPVADALINVAEAATSGFVTGYATDSAGNYNTGQTLAPGQYKVTASVGGSETITYNGRFSIPTGDPVTVVNGAITGGIDITLPLLGRITGFVRNAANSAPLPGAVVEAFDFGANSFVVGATAAADGSYTINNLNPFQQYRVRARLVNFGTIFASNRTSTGTADVVTVPAGGATLLDFALTQNGGGIVGQVFDAVTLAPLSGVLVDFFDGATSNFSINNFIASSVTTDVNGNFNSGRGLAPGLYKVRARKTGSGYLTALYVSGRDLASATPVTVVQGADTTANIPMTMGGIITGTIRDRASNQPLSGASVTARRSVSSSFFGDFTVTTDANGNYTVAGLDPGQWLIAAQETGHVLGWYSGDPNNLAGDFSTSREIPIVGAETVPGINLNLVLGGGQIRGRVTRTDNGQPVAAGTNINIRGPWPRTSSVSPASVLTTAQGDYSFGGLPPGRYIIEADRVQTPNGTAIGFFPFGAISRGTGVPVAVADGEVVTRDFQVLGFSGGASPRAISGTLRTPSNAPVRAAFAFAFDPTGNSFIKGGTVFYDGSFVIDGLPPGRYLVHARTEAGTAWTNFPAELTLNTASLVDVTAGDVSGINIVMPDNPGTITGTITRSDNGQPVAGASISLRTFLDATPTGGTSEVDGTYLVRGAVPGQYKLRVSAPGFVTKFYKVGVPSGARSLEEGSFVTVTAGANTAAINVVLDPTGGALTGTVRRQGTLEPVVATIAAIHDAVTGNRVTAVSTDAAGVWRTEGLGPGTYTLSVGDVQASRHATQWYSGEGTLLSADPVTVAAVGVTGGVDVLVSAVQGSASGRVFRSDGATPLADAVVEILDAATGGLVRRAMAGSNGVWQAPGLAPGSNRYIARARALGFADKFFPSVPSRTGATPLTVVNGGDTPNINFSMTLSGDVTGRVSYGGAQTGVLVIGLFRGPGFTERAYQAVVPTPAFGGGQVYAFRQAAPDTRGVLPETYQVRAFLDVNGNGVQDPTEASGSPAGSVSVAEAVIVTGADFTLTDPAATTNGAPVANAQTMLVVQGTSNNSIILTGEDAETATANLTYAVTANPLHGTLTTTLNPQQRLYTPAAGFTGTDTFTFTVTDRGDPDGCGAPGPTCAAALTSAPGTVTIQVAPNAGTTSQALGSPAIPVNSTGFALGNIRIDENAVGVLAAGSAIRVGLPAGLAFVGTPTVSLALANRAVLNPPVRESNTVIAFTLASPSTTGPASILVSAIVVNVPSTFLDDGVTSAAVLTTVFGTNPGVTSVTLQNATVVAPAAGPALTDVSPATAARGTAGRVVVVTGANFAADATLSFGAGVTAAVVVDGPDQITATLTVAAGAALGLRDVVVTNVGAAQSATKSSAFEITGPPAIQTVSGPLVQGLDNQLVTIRGASFGAPTTTPSDLLVSVSGAGITISDVGYTDPSTLTAIVSVGAAVPTGTYDVGVTNPDGGSASGSGLLRVVVTDGLPAPPSKNPAPPPPPPPPVVGSLSASAGPIGSTVTITGSNFGSAPSVSFAGTGGARLTAAVSGASASSVTATVPAGATTGNVTVSANGLVSSGVAFTVTTPVLAAVVPNALTTDPAAVRQVPVVLSGSRFVLGATVSFGGPVGDLTPVGGATVSTDGLTLTQMVSIAPTLQLVGARDVTVKNPGTCVAPAPATCLSSTLVGGIQIQPPPAATFAITLPDLADDSTYLPSVGQVTLTRLATGACSPATKVVTPAGVRLQARFVNATGLVAPASVTFTIASSALPGTAANEDCELDPANPTKDFSVGQPTSASQQVVVLNGGGGIYQTTLFSYDWGGKVTVTVSGTTGAVTATASRLFPADADGDDLPDPYEKNGALNGGALSFQNSDQNGNTVKDRDDRFARDGLSNFEKYRGVYLAGPIAGGTGPLGGFQRLGAGVRHLFVRGRGFRDDPAIPAGFCGINPATGAPVADPTLTAANPCPVFEVGGAFAEIGVAVHNVSSSFTATSELPRVSLVNPTQPALDLLTVVYDGVNCKGTEACGTISKTGVRLWANATLGYTTPNGTATTYGAATIYKRAIECYFNCRPYEHRTNDPARVVAAPDGTAMLAPIAVVSDSSATGRDNGRADTGETLINGALAGDTYIPGSFTQQLSALDVNNDGCVELPTQMDPTTVARCNTAAGTAAVPSATKQQVVRSVLTHELGHATGVATHTTDSTDLMYVSTINFTRDGHFSSAAAGLVQIHNKGAQ